MRFLIFFSSCCLSSFNIVLPFRYVEKIDEADLKSKEVTAVSDLLSALKLLCNQVSQAFKRFPGLSFSEHLSLINISLNQQKVFAVEGYWYFLAMFYSSSSKGVFMFNYTSVKLGYNEV